MQQDTISQSQLHLTIALIENAIPHKTIEEIHHIIELYLKKTIYNLDELNQDYGVKIQGVKIEEKKSKQIDGEGLQVEIDYDFDQDLVFDSDQFEGDNINGNGNINMNGKNQPNGYTDQLNSKSNPITNTNYINQHNNTNPYQFQQPPLSNKHPQISTHSIFIANQILNININNKPHLFQTILQRAFGKSNMNKQEFTLVTYTLMAQVYGLLESIICQAYGANHVRVKTQQQNYHIVQMICEFGVHLSKQSFKIFKKVVKRAIGINSALLPSEVIRLYLDIEHVYLLHNKLQPLHNHYYMHLSKIANTPVMKKKVIIDQHIDKYGEGKAFSGLKLKLEAQKKLPKPKVSRKMFPGEWNEFLEKKILRLYIEHGQFKSVRDIMHEQNSQTRQWLSRQVIKRHIFKALRNTVRQFQMMHTKNSKLSRHPLVPINDLLIKKIIETGQNADLRRQLLRMRESRWADLTNCLELISTINRQEIKRREEDEKGKINIEKRKIKDIKPNTKQKS